MHKQQSGFGLIEILVAVVVIAVLAGAGYLFVQNMNSQSDNTSNDNSSTESASMDHEDHESMMDGWQTFTSSTYDFSCKYPSTNGEYWCQGCTYTGYEAKGVNNWIPLLVADGFIKRLPQDTRTNQGSACNPSPSNSYAGYVYYSPSPPNNTDYKLFAFCTPPKSVLNADDDYPSTPYCLNPSSYDSSQFDPRPAGQPELKPFVDPVRPDYAYAIYTPGLACL